MSDQLFNQYGPQNNNPMLQRFNDFKKSFTGNPQEQIQQMLNSGKISQAQYNQAVQKANALRQLFGV